jgi:PHS family inorganic phosphate transporter-like MFS transporter
MVQQARPSKIKRNRTISSDVSKIFAVNTVLPMLEIVYWRGNMTQAQAVLIELSLLTGTFFGQLFFGILADRYGRRKMYGVELLILTTATLLIVVASKGALASTNALGWIAAWRFVMGIGIGRSDPYTCRGRS